MVFTPNFLSVSNATPVVESMEISGGSPETSGLTQIALRGNKGPRSFTASPDKVNLPDVPDSELLEPVGDSDGSIHIISRTLNEQSPSYLFEEPVNSINGLSAYSSQFVELILPGRYKIVGYDYPRYTGPAVIEQGTPGEIVLNYRGARGTVSQGEIVAQTGFTILYTSGRSVYRNNLNTNLSYRELTEDDATYRTAGSPDINGYVEYADLYLRLAPDTTEDSGTSFHIWRDGQLVPATPHLWSGGQLTPTTLQLQQ